MSKLMKSLTILFQFAFLRTILVVTMGIIILGSLLYHTTVHPQYAKLLIRFVEDEAKRTALHISAYQDLDSEYPMRRVSPETMQEIPLTIDHFNLEKIKIFDDQGVVVYSTDNKDIGIKNTKPYFIALVKKGIPYSKVVHRDDQTLEGRTVYQDVVETYIPVIRNNLFLGAFEIY